MRARELPAPSAAVAALVAAGAAVCAAEAADPVRQARAALRWAAGAFGRRLVVASSMADGVLAHLASVEAPGVDVLFLDTGYHFAETLAMRDVVAREYPVRMITVLPRSPRRSRMPRTGRTSGRGIPTSAAPCGRWSRSSAPSSATTRG